jgi:hypothetical protein
MSQLLLTVASIVDSSLSTSNVPTDSFAKNRRIECCFLDIMSTSCHLLSILERQVPKSSTVVECFCICTTALSSSVEKYKLDVSVSRDMDNAYHLRLCEILQQYDTIRSLLVQARLYQSEPMEYGPVMSVLDVLTKMASMGDSTMLSFLLGSATMIFTPMWQRSAYTNGDAHRNTAPNGRPHDIQQNLHFVWIAQLNLIASCLYSASRNILVELDQNGAERLFKFTVSFLVENQESLLRCMDVCSAVEFGQKASKDQTFSLMILNEAKLAVGIVSVLCTRATIDIFKGGHTELLQVFTHHATLLLVGLSTYVGASAMARDLFSVLNDIEEADSVTTDSGLDLLRHGPAQRIFANGQQNAKHEAIRLTSHFVLNCVKVTTLEEEAARRTFCIQRENSKKININAELSSTTTAAKISSLERECRSGITNLFAFQTELEAAECLISVIRILRITHPASSSFFQYRDDLRLVVPGMVITYHDDDQGYSPLKLAKVLRCDTVNRRWFVQPIVDEDDDYHETTKHDDNVVYNYQLVGWEDHTRRVPMLSLLAAPESSSDLDKLSKGPRLSIGHLVMTLRWCCQFHEELLLSSDILSNHDAGRASSIPIRLAEVASSLLGLDLSVHQETRKRQGLSDHTNSTSTDYEMTNIRIIADQILDLFGATSDFYDDKNSNTDAVETTKTNRRIGRLNGLLCTESWCKARIQLKAYIQLAQQRNRC